MRIIFNLIDTGLGNNGGSFTLIKSANTLAKMGYDVKIISSGRNENTWEFLEVPHIVVKKLKQIPDADVIIATGIKSIESTNNSNIKLKAHWVRGWEIWRYPEEKLVKILQESPTVKIVNSICLQDKLKQFGIDSYVIRPGYDVEYFPRNLRGEGNFIIGGIYNEGVKRTGKRVEWIFKCFDEFRKRFGSKVELYMYGSEGHPVPGSVSYYKFNACSHDKNYIYNKIDIWLAPSCLEGLHIPPMEAGLTEAAVVATNAEMSGTQDYIIHNQTGIVSENNLDSFILQVEQLLENPEKRKQLGTKGREKILELGDRKTNMKRMVELLQTLKGD